MLRDQQTVKLALYGLLIMASPAILGFIAGMILGTIFGDEVGLGAFAAILVLGYLHLRRRWKANMAAAMENLEARE